MTVIILSYKPLVPNRLWLRKPPQLCLNPCPPASIGRTSLFVFQTHILRHLNRKKKVTEGRINYVFLSYFTKNTILIIIDDSVLAFAPILFLDCLMTYRYLKPPQGYFAPQVDMSKHGNFTYSVLATWHAQREVNVSISEVSNAHTDLSHHPWLQHSLWKKQMITTKGQTTSHSRCCKWWGARFTRRSC